MKRIYHGRRFFDHGSEVRFVDDGATFPGLLLPLRLDLVNHSPTGFEWGYGGSGPAQLALAMLAHHLGDDRRALEHYFDFKFRVIAGLSHDEWILTSDEIDRHLEEIARRTA